MPDTPPHVLEMPSRELQVAHTFCGTHVLRHTRSAAHTLCGTHALRHTRSAAMRRVSRQRAQTLKPPSPRPLTIDQLERSACALSLRTNSFQSRCRARQPAAHTLCGNASGVEAACTNSQTLKPPSPRPLTIDQLEPSACALSLRTDSFQSRFRTRQPAYGSRSIVQRRL